MFEKGLCFSGTGHFICKQRAFFNNEFTQQSNEQMLVDALRYKNGCAKLTTKKLILEPPFYDVKQNKTLIYGIEADGEYDVSNNYLKMHGIPAPPTTALTFSSLFAPSSTLNFALTGPTNYLAPFYNPILRRSRASLFSMRS